MEQGYGVGGDGLSVLSKPQRGSLIPPIEGQTRVDHQLVGGEPRGLLSSQDRGDDIRGEEGQPHEACRIRGCDPFFTRNVLKGRTAGLEHSLADFPTPHQEPDQRRIRWSRTCNAIDDELHLFAGSFQAGRNAQPDQGLFGAIGVRVRCPNPSGDPVAAAFAHKSSDQTRRADVKVNAIGVNLRLDEDGAHQVVQRFRRQTISPSRERGRRVPQLFLHRRIRLAIRDRVQDFDGIGEERAQAADDKRFEI